jgi:hypothetical protein
MLDNKLSKLVEESNGTFRDEHKAQTPKNIIALAIHSGAEIIIGNKTYSSDSLSDRSENELKTLGVEWLLYVDEIHIGTYIPSTAILYTNETDIEIKEPGKVTDNPRVTGDERAKLEDKLAKAEGDLYHMKRLYKAKRLDASDVQTMDELEIDISDMHAALDDGMLVKESKVVEENIASDLAAVKVKIEDTKERLANVDSELDEVNSELDGLNISDDEEIEIEDDDNDTDDVDIEIEDDDSEDDDDKEIEIEDDDSEDDDDEEIEIEDDDDVVEESNGNITVDIDFTYPDGWEAILKEANLTGVKTGDTQLDLTGTKADIRDYLLGGGYGMAVEDLEEIFPELS